MTTLVQTFAAGTTYLRAIARTAVLVAAGLGLIAGAADAAPFKRIENRWKPGQYIHVEHGDVEAGPIKMGWFSAQWKLRRADGFIRFENKWKPGQFLHIEHGDLELGPIEPGWWSAQWTMEPAEAGFSRICNRWKQGQCLHIEQGDLEVGEVEPGWWSAMWRLRN